MNVICSICSESLVQTDDIFYTRCGHVFHFQCLTQWLERSKSCPQCREKVTQSRIHRLYFTFSSNEVCDSQCSTFQERIDNLQFKILLKEKDIKYFTSQKLTLEKQNAGLRKEVRKLEEDMNQKISAIHALKEQTNYFRGQSLQCDNLKKEITQLKNKIEDLKPIQMLLNAPTNDVSHMVGKSKDPNVLLTYISVMKKELSARFNKCKQLRVTIKKLQEDFEKISTKCDSLVEEESKRIDLEEKLAVSESKNLSLQKRVEELQEILGINENCNTDSMQQEEDTNNSVEKSPVEKTLKKDKSNQETSFKIPKINKRKKEKASKHSAEYTLDEMSTVELNDSSDSDISFVNSISFTESSIISKRSRLSVDDTSILKQDNSKLSSYTIPKKRNVRKKIPQADESHVSGTIDLT